MSGKAQNRESPLIPLSNRALGRASLGPFPGCSWKGGALIRAQPGRRPLDCPGLRVSSQLGARPLSDLALAPEQMLEHRKLSLAPASPGLCHIACPLMSPPRPSEPQQHTFEVWEEPSPGLSPSEEPDPPVSLQVLRKSALRPHPLRLPVPRALPLPRPRVQLPGKGCNPPPASTARGLLSDVGWGC